VLEIGIGNAELMGKHIEGYSPGASLLMWRDYFPAATIFGCDILDVLFEGERIVTFHADQNDENSLLSMMAEISKLEGLPLDLIVDDGSHIFEHQEKSLVTLWRFLKQNGTYIIEDFSLDLDRFSEMCGLANKLPGCMVSQPSIPPRRRGRFIFQDNCLVFRKT
jgi:demethylmacrocin O-methyltransferase